ncbi:hypothetical protein Tco_0449589 [Tanacetum coccineum]
MVPPNSLRPNLNGKAVNKTHYRGMIGSLMYLTISKLDIQFSTCLYARHQANPKESHLIAVKRIFMYPKGKALQARILELKRRNVKITVLTTYTPEQVGLAGDLGSTNDVLIYKVPLSVNYGAIGRRLAKRLQILELETRNQGTLLIGQSIQAYLRLTSLET